MATCNFERDCATIPFPEKCVRFCVYQILGNISFEEKRLILGFDLELATSIFDAFNNYNISKFEDLEQHLESFQIEELLNKFKSITQYQLNYFKLPMSQRQIIIDALRRLHLDEEGSLGSELA